MLLNVNITATPVMPQIAKSIAIRVAARAVSHSAFLVSAYGTLRFLRQMKDPGGDHLNCCISHTRINSFI